MARNDAPQGTDTDTDIEETLQRAADDTDRETAVRKAATDTLRHIDVATDAEVAATFARDVTIAIRATHDALGDDYPQDYEGFRAALRSHLGDAVINGHEWFTQKHYGPAHYGTIIEFADQHATTYEYDPDTSTDYGGLKETAIHAYRRAVMDAANKYADAQEVEG